MSNSQFQWRKRIKVVRSFRVDCQEVGLDIWTILGVIWCRPAAPLCCHSLPCDCWERKIKAKPEWNVIQSYFCRQRGLCSPAQPWGERRSVLPRVQRMKRPGILVNSPNHVIKKWFRLWELEGFNILKELFLPGTVATCLESQLLEGWCRRIMRLQG